MYKSKTTAFKHQEKALELSKLKKNFAYFMEMGCVDGETEFLTHRGWMKFKDFDIEKIEYPFLVAQAIPSNDVTKWGYSFVAPEAFIHKKSSDWYTLKTSLTNSKSRPTYVMTGDHTIPIEYVHTRHNNRCTDEIHIPMPEATAKYLYQVHTNDKSRKPKYPADPKKYQLGYMSSTANRMSLIEDNSLFYEARKNNEVANLTPAELRFMVAVAADATYPNANDNKVDFYLTKGRKIERLQRIAAEAGITMAHEIKERRGSKTVHVFHAIAPIRCKVFDEKWYALSRHQLSAVAEELFYWDGNVTFGRAEFYTIHKASADFAQYALMANGWTARLYYQEPKKLWRLSANRNTLWSHDIAPYPLVPMDEIFMTKYRSFHEITHDTEERDCYCFRVPSGYLILRRGNDIIITGNSGKTKVMLDNIGELYDRQAITGALVLAPKGTYRNWADNEIPTHMPDDLDKQVLVWDAADSAGKKRQLVKDIENWNGKTLQIMVYNIESLVSEKGRILLSNFIKRHGGKVLALVDESTCIKNHKAKRTKAAIEIGKKCVARRIATGSPVTNSPLDLFSQCAFLDKKLLGFGSYYAFKNTYAVIERIQNRQGQSYDKILSYKNLDDLSDKLSRFSFRVTKKECLDLPDKIYTTRYVTLTPEQIRIYKEMSENLFTFVERDGEFSEMSANIVLTKILRLHQVLCGTFTADDGSIIPIPNYRMDALKEVLDETAGKAIIWATYRDNLFSLQEFLKNEYGEDSYVMYFGDTSSEDRTKAIELFQDESSPVRFFVGNVKTAGRGITLTAASTVIYYSNDFSLEFRQQSEDRAHRFGQKNNVTYVDLMVPHSIDEKIIRALIGKKNIANEVLKDGLEPWITLGAS